MNSKLGLARLTAIAACCALGFGMTQFADAQNFHGGWHGGGSWHGGGGWHGRSFSGVSIGVGPAYYGGGYYAPRYYAPPVCYPNYYYAYCAPVAPVYYGPGPGYYGPSVGISYYGGGYYRDGGRGRDHDGRDHGDGGGDHRPGGWDRGNYRNDGGGRGHP